MTFVGTEIINLTGDTTGDVSVRATNGNDAITQTGNTIAVNNHAIVNFTAYPTLNALGLDGDDVVSVEPTTLVEETSMISTAVHQRPVTG